MSVMILSSAQPPLEEVRKYAEQNVFTAQDMDDRVSGKLDRCPGDDPGYAAYIPMGYRVVFTVEEHREYGWLYHISISTARTNRVPNPVAVIEVAKVLGVTKTEPLCIWVEETNGALNMVFPK